MLPTQTLLRPLRFPKAGRKNHTMIRFGLQSPQSIAMNTQSIESYSIISFVEITAIMKAATTVPQSIFPVYLCLTHHCRSLQKSTCFPKIGTIRESLGNTLSERTIYRAIKWLKDHKIIRVNKARIKKSTGGTKTNTGRFNLLKRRVYRTSSSLSWSDSREKRKESTIIDKFSKSDDKKVCRQHGKADTINKHSKRTLIYTKNRRKLSKREQARRERQALEAKRRLITHPMKVSLGGL